MNQHVHKYAPELKQYVQSQLSELMYYFGYANVGENPCAYFNFDEHTEENLKRFDRFRLDN